MAKMFNIIISVDVYCLLNHAVGQVHIMGDVLSVVKKTRLIKYEGVHPGQPPTHLYHTPLYISRPYTPPTLIYHAPPTHTLTLITPTHPSHTHTHTHTYITSSSYITPLPQWTMALV